MTPTTPVARLLATIEPGLKLRHDSLEAVALSAPSSDHPPYRLLDPETTSSILVTEVDRAGSVPRLRVRNDLDVGVLLIDGQELVGARQNRILNCDVFVAPKEEIVIPVSCVERGRWAWRSAGFSPGKSSPRAVRARKSRRVADSLAADTGFAAGQREVWDEVESCLDALATHSPTGALHAAYEQREGELVSLRKAFILPEGTLGIAVYEHDRFLGLDLFDRASTLASYWETLLDSYALDHLVRKAATPPALPETPVRLPLPDVLRTAAEGPWKTYDSPGHGQDLRFQHPLLTGSALLLPGDHLLHLQLFPRA